MDFGSLVDCLFLTPGQFEKRYVIQPETYTNKEDGEKPWNWNSNTCKAWRNENRGLSIISKEKFDEAVVALERLNADPTIVSFLEQSDRQVWLSGEWKDKETKLKIPLKALIDIVPRADSEYSDYIADLKTTRDAAPMVWNRTVFNFGYHFQAALYLDMMQVIDPMRSGFGHIVQENKKPFETGKRIMHPDYLEIGRKEYEKALSDYCQCLKSGKFPGYDDTDEAVQGWSTSYPEPWMEQRNTFSTKYTF
jgi:exodeoxyribonuclease VIII